MDDVQRAFHNFIRDNSAPLVGVATPWNLETTYATRREEFLPISSDMPRIFEINYQQADGDLSGRSGPLVLAFASLDFTSEFGRASAQKVTQNFA